MVFMFQSLAVLGVSLVFGAWVVLRRLFWHPLSSFPGPKFAAATKWYEFYFDIIKRPGGTFMYEIERMHDVYGITLDSVRFALNREQPSLTIRRTSLTRAGPIVRINPEELHVKDSSWFDVLYTGPTSVMSHYPARSL